RSDARLRERVVGTQARERPQVSGRRVDAVAEYEQEPVDGPALAEPAVCDPADDPREPAERLRGPVDGGESRVLDRALAIAESCLRDRRPEVGGGGITPLPWEGGPVA